MKRKMLALAGSGVLLAGLGTAALTTGTAYAQSGAQFCASSTECWNAWNAGPDINQYKEGVVYNDFTYIDSSTSGDYNIEDEDGGAYQGDCFEDLGDSQTNARAGLGTGCGTSGIGWGGNVQLDFCGVVGGVDTYAFYDVHWKAYIGWSTAGSGDPVYLNSSKICYAADPAVG
jgi:hypothetical protein